MAGLNPTYRLATPSAKRKSILPRPPKLASGQQLPTYPSIDSTIHDQVSTFFETLSSLRVVNLGRPLTSRAQPPWKSLDDLSH